MDEIRYLISDASKKVDVETHVLRYWEEELGLSIPRNELGHRYYTGFHIRLFCQVKELKDKGYQLKAIKNALQQVMGAEQGRQMAMGQEQERQTVTEQEQKLQEAASLLERDITKALQSDPRLKGSLRLSLGKEATVTHLSDYSRLETGVMNVGMAPGGSDLERWGSNEEMVRPEDWDRSDAEDGQKIEDEEKAEKDGRMDMKNKRKERKKPSAWERRNGVVNSTQIKGGDVDRDPRKEGAGSAGVRQEEIVSRAVRKEGAGKACVERILGGKEETEWEAWPIKQVIDGGAYERTTAKDAAEGAKAEYPEPKEAEIGSTVVDLAEREVSARGAAEWDETERHTADRETAERGATEWETAEKGAAERETAEQGAAEREAAEQEAAVTAIAVQESTADTGLVFMTQEEKLERFQVIMEHIIGKALEMNNEKLSQDISRLVHDDLVEEMADLIRIRDEREEERFRHLDEVIRSCQRDRLGRAEAAATRIPFFRKKRFGRNGRTM